jgi:pyrophosphatase PpaX
MAREDRVFNNRKIKAVLFDLDGTLIASEKTSRLALDSLLRRHNYENIPDEIIHSFRGMPTRKILAHIDPGNVTQLLQEIVELEKTYLDYSQLYPGTLETIQALSNDQIKLGVVTSQAAPEVDLVRSHFQLGDLIHVWVSADDVQNPKPHPESIDKAVETLNVLKEQTLLIGDTHYDIEAARRAGVFSGVALWGSNDVHELMLLNPDYLFAEPGEIGELCLL